MGRSFGSWTSWPQRSLWRLESRKPFWLAVAGCPVRFSVSMAVHKGQQEGPVRKLSFSSASEELEVFVKNTFLHFEPVVANTRRCSSCPPSIEVPESHCESPEQCEETQKMINKEILAAGQTSFRHRSSLHCVEVRRTLLRRPGRIFTSGCG